VHFSALKHPVVGDTLYGAAAQLIVGKTNSRRSIASSCTPHAFRLVHPRTEKQIAVTAPLAADLKLYLEKLAAASGSSKIDASLLASYNS